MNRAIISLVLFIVSSAIIAGKLRNKRPLEIIDVMWSFGSGLKLYEFLSYAVFYLSWSFSFNSHMYPLLLKTTAFFIMAFAQLILTYYMTWLYQDYIASKKTK